MAKLRQNIVTGKWVVIAPERAKRPEDFVMASAPKRHLDQKCPFCIDSPDSAYLTSIKEAETENIYVIPNKYPAFSQSEEIVEEGGNFYFSTKAIGGHEVIVIKNHDKEVYDSPEILDELFGVYQNRYKKYLADPTIEYAMPIHNLGPEAAASIEHPHSQFFASSILPNLIEEELCGAKLFHADKGSCVFCDMITEEKDHNVRLISENDDFVAFTFFASRFPFEVWVLPKKHQLSFEEIPDSERKNFAKIVFDVLGRLNRSLKFPPFNWWIHSSPTKKDHLDPFYHWHLEIAPRVSKFGGYEMGSGIVIDVVSPELAAEFLRKA